jgi:hypothetical protein
MSYSWIIYNLKEMVGILNLFLLSAVSESDIFLYICAGFSDQKTMVRWWQRDVTMVELQWFDAENAMR